MQSNMLKLQLNDHIPKSSNCQKYKVRLNYLTSKMSVKIIGIRGEKEVDLATNKRCIVT